MGLECRLQALRLAPLAQHRECLPMLHGGLAGVVPIGNPLVQKFVQRYELAGDDLEETIAGISTIGDFKLISAGDRLSESIGASSSLASLPLAAEHASVLQVGSPGRRAKAISVRSA